ncbi:MAG: PIN domain-containing protein [Candidatus Aenigmatarchaeota archaeon]
MKKILVDTNCIIYIVKNKIDFFEEINKLIQEPFEIYVTESVINELEKISTKKTKNSMFARIALMIIKKNKFKIIKGKYMNADKDILYITNKNWIVITNDKRLKRLLSQKNTRAISVREFVKIDF